MQDIWARILAGEIKQPKSFSLRTLNLVRNLSKADAEVFAKAAKLRIYSNPGAFIYKSYIGDFLDKLGFPFEDRLLLLELGILQPESNLHITLQSLDRPSLTYFQTVKHFIKLEREANLPEHDIPILRFSEMGQELLNLIIAEPDETYIKAFAKALKTEKATVEFAYILKKEEGNIQHTLPWQQFD